MAKETGKIVAIELGRMKVKMPTGEGCEMCGLKKACTYQGPDSAYRFFEVSHVKGAEVGDLATVETNNNAQNISALIVFGSPIILFAITYMLLHGLFHLSYSEIWSTVVTMVLYVVALIYGNRLVDRLPALQPKVAEIHKKPGKLSKGGSDKEKR